MYIRRTQVGLSLVKAFSLAQTMQSSGVRAVCYQKETVDKNDVKLFGGFGLVFGATWKSPTIRECPTECFQNNALAASILGAHGCGDIDNNDSNNKRRLLALCQPGIMDFQTKGYCRVRCHCAKYGILHTK